MLRWILVLAVALSGCSDPSTAAEAPADDAKTQLQGVLVDGAIVPIADANITLVGGNTTTTTDASGAWRLDVEPGRWILEASKPGYITVQTTSVAVAGTAVKVPITMVKAQGLTPFVVSGTWEGFVECSTRIGTGGASGSLGINACNDVGRQDVDHATSFPDGTPTWFQNELSWQSTQIGGNELSLVVGPEACNDVKWYRADGPSPLAVDMDSFELAARGMGEDAGLCSRVFTWTSGALAHLAGVQLQQGFSTFSHAFYHFEPPQGWLFIVDGPPVVP